MKKIRGGGKLSKDYTSQQYRQLQRQTTTPPPTTPPALLVLPDYLTGATGSGWHGFMGFVQCALLNYGWEKWHCDSCSSQGVAGKEAKWETQRDCARSKSLLLEQEDRRQSSAETWHTHRKHAQKHTHAHTGLFPPLLKLNMPWKWREGWG